MGEWVPAGKLRIGDAIRKADGRYGVVQASAFVYQPQPMYNLTVAAAHTYFVGDGQWLVHNNNNNCWKFNPDVDLDWRGTGKNVRDAINEAFRRAGVSPNEFTIMKWGYDANGKSWPVEWRVLSGPNQGAEVNVDVGHLKNGPTVPHVGYQTPGKRGGGGAVRGHILLDQVPYNR